MTFTVKSKFQLKKTMKLTDQQSRVLSEFVDRMKIQGVVALCGSAGTGKTTVLAEVPRYLENVIYAAPTHAAVRVLRSKLQAAGHEVPIMTYHAACLKPEYKPEFVNLLRSFRSGNMENLQFPGWNTNDLERAKREASKASDEEEFLHAMRIQRDDWIERWVTRGENTNSIIIDEASMLHVNDLEEIRKSFSNIGLVGDHRQLYPVDRNSNSNASALLLFMNEDLRLTKILRTDNRHIIQSARYAWNNGCCPELERSEYGSEHAARYIPIICFMNKTRLAINANVRQLVQGSSVRQLLKGDCLVLRSRLKPHEIRSGMHNNSMWIVNSIKSRVAYLVSREDKSIQWNCPLDYISVEDFDMPVRKYNFRFAWAITCHMAQGSEYDTVFIAPDMLWNGSDTASRWWYTAITRAKRNVLLLGG